MSSPPHHRLQQDISTLTMIYSFKLKSIKNLKGISLLLITPTALLIFFNWKKNPAAGMWLQREAKMARISRISNARESYSTIWCLMYILCRLLDSKRLLALFTGEAKQQQQHTHHLEMTSSLVPSSINSSASVYMQNVDYCINQNPPSLLLSTEHEF